jgi:RNA polymerase sigma-70 factor (ECF subfamily)
VQPLEFGDVFRQHFDFVWRALRSFGVRDIAVDDAVQDVFLCVHRRLPEFEGRSSLKTWIYSIAYRTAQNHRRGARRHATVSLETVAIETQPASPEQSPGERVQTAEAGQFVLAFLDQLPAEQRDVFVLCVLEELTAPDAAEVLQVKLNTVYSRLRLARAEFRQALARFAAAAEGPQ